MNGEYVKCPKCKVMFSPFYFAGSPYRGIMHDCPQCGELVKFCPADLHRVDPVLEKELRESGKWVKSQEEIHTEESQKELKKEYQAYLKMSPKERKKLSNMQRINISLYELIRK